MKSLILLPIVTAGSFALHLTTLSSHAQSPHKPHSIPQPTTQPIPLQLSGTITALNPRESTVTILDSQNTQQTLHVGPETRLTRDGRDTPRNSLKEGEKIRATTHRAADIHHALSIDVESALSR